MHDGVQSLLVLEDDACIDVGLREAAIPFLRFVPNDWDQLYLGGQHLGRSKYPPNRINEHVIAPRNVNRTHAYAVSQKGMPKLYQWMCTYPSDGPPRLHHLDHWFGELHKEGSLRVYAPNSWFIGQMAGTSDIAGRSTPLRTWNGRSYGNGATRPKRRGCGCGGRAQ